MSLGVFRVGRGMLTLLFGKDLHYFFATHHINFKLIQSLDNFLQVFPFQIPHIEIYAFRVPMFG
jgi:hypothetical protein